MNWSPNNMVRTGSCVVHFNILGKYIIIVIQFSVITGESCICKMHYNILKTKHKCKEKIVKTKKTQILIQIILCLNIRETFITEVG